MKVYVASPLGFAHSTRPFLAELLTLLQRSDLTVFDPWSQGYERLISKASSAATRNGRGRIPKLQEANRFIANANEKAIRSADLVIAVLDGVDVDSGTASEVGFAYALGKRIVGLRTDFRQTGDNEAATVNLQVQYWIEASGGSIVHNLDQLNKAITGRRRAASTTE